MVAAAAVARVINTEEGALRGIPTIINPSPPLSAVVGFGSDERRRETKPMGAMP